MKTTKSPLQKILKGILLTEDKSKHIHESMQIIKPQEKRIEVNRE
jgi:hypothetical protein